MAKPLSKTVVVAYGRSAVAKSGKKGALRNLHPIDMGGLVLKGVMVKIPELDPALVEDVILGCAIPEAKQGLNPARLVAARAGLPYTACGLTVDRFCSSSLQAVALAAWQIEAGQADCIVAGGIESMTALPMTLDRSGDGILQYVMLEGEPGHQDTLLRTEYSVQILTEGGLTVEKLASNTANWDRSQANASQNRTNHHNSCSDKRHMAPQLGILQLSLIIWCHPCHQN